jgi:hypothetical protein
MKRLLLLALLVVVAVPAQAHAAAPCRNKIFNDWYADGKIASTYPHACYTDALRHIPPDAAVYSSLSDDITAAMRAADRRAAGKAVPSQVGHGFSTKAVLATSHTSIHDPAIEQRTSTGPAGSASGEVADSGGVPVPILVLGGLALALAAAGTIGAGVKYARSRRG